jgi:hypothetical protein
LENYKKNILVKMDNTTTTNSAANSADVDPNRKLKLGLGLGIGLGIPIVVIVLCCVFLIPGNNDKQPWYSFNPNPDISKQPNKPLTSPIPSYKINTSYKPTPSTVNTPDKNWQIPDDIAIPNSNKIYVVQYQNGVYARNTWSHNLTYLRIVVNDCKPANNISKYSNPNDKCGNDCAAGDADYEYIKFEDGIDSIASPQSEGCGPQVGVVGLSDTYPSYLPKKGGDTVFLGTLQNKGEIATIEIDKSDGFAGMETLDGQKYVAVSQQKVV